MVKATWQGHQIYMVDVYQNGWAKIAFQNDWYHSPLTGTGACYVSIDDIVLEEA